MKNKVTLTCVMGVDPEKFDLNLIYHFIAHYRNLGVEKFLITVNAINEEKTQKGIKILGECRIVPEKIWIGEFLEGPKMKELNALQETVTTPWIIAVDSDEFVRLDKRSLEKLINDCEEKGYVACNGQFVDRIAANRNFPPVLKYIDLYDQFPIEDNILQKYTEEKKRLNDSKYAITFKCFLFKSGEYKSSNGQHFLCYKKALNVADDVDRLEPQYYNPEWFKLDHFKWTETCAYRIKKRLEAFTLDPRCSWTDEIQWVYNFINNHEIRHSS
jgi:Glycosyl transferase family 2